MQVVNVHAVLDRSLVVECSVRHGIYSGLYTTGGQSNRSSQCPLVLTVNACSSDVNVIALEDC